MWRDNADHISPNRTIIFCGQYMGMQCFWVHRENKHSGKCIIFMQTSPGITKAPLFEFVPENCVNFRWIESNARKSQREKKKKEHKSILSIDLLFAWVECCVEIKQKGRRISHEIRLDKHICHREHFLCCSRHNQANGPQPFRKYYTHYYL